MGVPLEQITNKCLLAWVSTNAFNCAEGCTLCKPRKADLGADEGAGPANALCGVSTDAAVAVASPSLSELAAEAAWGGI